MPREGQGEAPGAPAAKIVVAGAYHKEETAVTAEGENGQTMTRIETIAERAVRLSILDGDNARRVRDYYRRLDEAHGIPDTDAVLDAALRELAMEPQVIRG